MKNLPKCTYDITDMNNLEIYHETIESLFHLNSCDGVIKDILNISIEPKILKKYVFRAPVIEHEVLNYGYKIKLMLNVTYNIEFTEDTILGATKFLSKDRLLNVTFILPPNYEEGKTVNIIPTVIDISHNIINKTSLYLSSYISFSVII